MTSTYNDVLYKHAKYINDVIMLNLYNDVSRQIYKIHTACFYIYRLAFTAASSELLKTADLISESNTTKMSILHVYNDSQGILA